MTSGFIIPKDINVWADSIGGFIINFGSTQFLAFKWIEKIRGRKRAINSIGDPFTDNAKRIL
jgi:hypothetical protein